MAFTNNFSGYCVEYIKYQKILYSPLKKEGFVPDSGSEVFVRNIPHEDNEYDLIEFFEKIGDIFQLRLMMGENGKKNRGFAYVTYVDSDLAKKAVTTLNAERYRGKCYLQIEQSMNNCRLFIGGIPTQKTKDQTWQELYKNGVKNIMDVIMYRSYTDRAENRGFVFVEFKTHEQAAYFRARYGKTLRLWDTPVIVDWSVPVPQVDPLVMERVKILYLRNLDVSELPEIFERTILRFVAKRYLEKVFKFKNYAFVHLETREIAENLLKSLKEYYKGTPVEVTWAKPPSKFTSQEYRQKKVRKSLSAQSSPPIPCPTSRMTFNEMREAVFNSGLYGSPDSTEEMQTIWPQLPGSSGMNNLYQPTYLHESPSNSTSVIHDLSSTTSYDYSRSTSYDYSRSTSYDYSSPTPYDYPSPTSYDYSSDVLNYLLNKLQMKSQCTSTNELDVPVLASCSSTPSLPEYVTLGRSASVEDHRGWKLSETNIAMSISPTPEMPPIAVPSYSSLLKSTVPEGIDPIKEYQRSLQRVYHPRSEVFDLENMRREMDIIPRNVTFEELRHFVGDILDDFLEEETLVPLKENFQYH